MFTTYGVWLNGAERNIREMRLALPFDPQRNTFHYAECFVHTSILDVHIRKYLNLCIPRRGKRNYLEPMTQDKYLIHFNGFRNCQL